MKLGTEWKIMIVMFMLLLVVIVLSEPSLRKLVLPAEVRYEVFNLIRDEHGLRRNVFENDVLVRAEFRAWEWDDWVTLYYYDKNGQMEDTETRRKESWLWLKSKGIDPESQQLPE